MFWGQTQHSICLWCCHIFLHHLVSSFVHFVFMMFFSCVFFILFMFIHIFHFYSYFSCFSYFPCLFIYLHIYSYFLIFLIEKTIANLDHCRSIPRFGVAESGAHFGRKPWHMCWRDSRRFSLFVQSVQSLCFFSDEQVQPIQPWQWIVFVETLQASPVITFDSDTSLGRPLMGASVQLMICCKLEYILTKPRILMRFASKMCMKFSCSWAVSLD